METAVTCRQLSVAAQRRQHNRRVPAIARQWQGSSGGQRGSRAVVIARRQQRKGDGDDRPKDMRCGSALLLLPLLAMPPKNKGAAEQWQWRA